MFLCRESIISLKKKYLKTEAEEGPCLSQLNMDGILDAIAKEGCSSLLEEVFLDLEVSVGGAEGCKGLHVLWSSLSPVSCSFYM